MSSISSSAAEIHNPRNLSQPSGGSLRHLILISTWRLVQGQRKEKKRLLYILPVRQVHDCKASISRCYCFRSNEDQEDQMTKTQGGPPPRNTHLRICKTGFLNDGFVLSGVKCCEDPQSSCFTLGSRTCFSSFLTRKPGKLLLLQRTCWIQVSEGFRPRHRGLS